MKKRGTKIAIVLTLLLVSVSGWVWVLHRSGENAVVPGKNRDTARPVPVETAPVLHGPITLVRTFSGELQALEEFVVAPKVAGRVEQVMVNIADTVQRGQVVAELDNDEYVQAVAQSQADLAVARANLSEAESALEIAQREFKRTESLLARGIASASEFDAARQALTVKQAQLKVSSAQLAKAESSLEISKIRLRYTKVSAGWAGGGDQRVVAERYVDEGQTVAANTPLLLIVELNPIVGVVFVTEKDYARLKPGQKVTLSTDAYPGDHFSGRIDRIAPVFDKSTRQAKIELIVDNPLLQLKPGMFIRATVVMDTVAEATIVPEQALTRREGQNGVFVVGKDGRTVVWRDVTIGIREGNRVQVEGQGISGRVVILGQQLIKDGSLITDSTRGEQTPDRSQKAESQ